MGLRAPFAFAFLGLVGITGGGFFLACSSGGGQETGNADGGGGGSSCTLFVPPASFDASSPVVGFESDVVPIFVASCSFPSCHGLAGAPQGDLYLGANAELVYASLVGVASSGYPSMDRVKPGDPANSYLLHRIDGDACSLAGCTSTGCAELMPQGGPSLAEAKLLTIRAWVVQGAQSDLPSEDAGTDAGVSATDASGATSPDAGKSDASDASGD